MHFPPCHPQPLVLSCLGRASSNPGRGHRHQLSIPHSLPPSHHVPVTSGDKGVPAPLPPPQRGPAVSLCKPALNIGIKGSAKTLSSIPTQGYLPLGIFPNGSSLRHPIVLICSSGSPFISSLCARIPSSISPATHSVHSQGFAAMNFPTAGLRIK